MVTVTQHRETKSGQTKPGSAETSAAKKSARPTNKGNGSGSNSNVEVSIPQYLAPQNSEAAAEGKSEKKPAKPKSAQAEAAPDSAPPVLSIVPDVAVEGEALELLMPEPSEGLTGDDQSRLSQSGRNASAASSAQEVLPSADDNVSVARGAVEEPATETSARAEAALAAELGERPAPSSEIEQLCERILAVIHARQPPDEDSLIETDPEEEAQAAGSVLETSVEGDVENVEAGYDELNQPAEGEPEQLPEEIQTPPESVETPGINAQQAVPEEVPEETVDLGPDVQASADRMESAGMNSEPAQLVENGPIADARDGQGELGEMAERDPAEVLAEQQMARDQASSDMAALQEQALLALQSTRADSVVSTAGQQQGMVGSEEQMRTQISSQAQGIFNDAQTRVNALLDPLTDTAMQRWETGVNLLSTDFESDLARVKSWLDERYSGVGGFFNELGDDAFGKPAWVTRAYNQAEENFANGVCKLIREISTQVNGIIETCETIIADANTRISDLFSNLPESLQQWAAGEQANFATRLDQLHNKVTSTRDDFNKNLADNAAQAVQQVRERIHELREAAKGLLGRIADAIDAFLDDPAKFIIEGLLSLLGIAASAFWAVVDKIGTVINDIADDPMNFANNLVTAVGQGFQGFFDRFSDHILGGFFDWMFSGLGSVGVEIPSDFSLKSLITFFLQLMGITWDRIKKLLAKHIGEENVELIEKAFELVSTLIEEGPEGIFEMIKEQLNPQTILDQVIDAAIGFMMEALIMAVTPRIIAMFNPAGAIVQAIEVIYRVLKWIFDNAARIFSLVETIVNGAADLIAGNTGGMASAVEASLAKLIAPVIDFLAGFLGLGNLPDKIADTIKGFQDWIMGIIEKVIDWLAKKAKSLLKSLGIGGKDDDNPHKINDDDVGKTVKFDGHRLWFDVQGLNVTVMVASDKCPVETQLGKWVEEAKGFDDEKKSEAEGLINTARTQLETTEADGKDATKEKRDIEQDPGNATQNSEFKEADDKAEESQDTLGGTLKKLFEIFGGEGGVLVHLGEKFVERGSTGSSGTKTEDKALISKPPQGYIMPNRSGRIHIQRKKAGDETTPQVHIDEAGILQLGPSKAKSATDEEKIEVYNKILNRMGFSPLPNIDDVDKYREGMRNKVVGGKGAVTIARLDERVLSYSEIPSQYNRVKGEIFELWIQNNLGISRPGPVFKHPSLEKTKRLADGVTESGNTLVEAKALSSLRGPSDSEKTQMDDYGFILSQGIEGVVTRGNKTETRVYSQIKYYFNKLGLPPLWYDDLLIRIGFGSFSTDPFYADMANVTYGIDTPEYPFS